MNWIYADTIPQMVSVEICIGQQVATVNIMVQETIIDGQQGYKYLSVKVKDGCWDYDTIVSSIITSEYPFDKMQAIQNNYLASPEDAQILQEFQEMQQFRRDAKQAAKECLQYAEQNNLWKS